MDAMKKRVGAFTEGVVVMVCPVLLAASLKKVDMRSHGNGPLRGSISPLAAFTLEAGLLPFLCLCLSKLLADRLAGVLFRASKLLVHLSALLLMALAYCILLLISTKTVYYLSVLLPLLPLTLWRGYRSARSDHDHDAAVYQGCEGRLEISVDFSAAVTALLFLGLEGLALEGQSSRATGVEPRLLAASLGVSFVTCVAGVFIMLLATVPPLITGDSDSAAMCDFIAALNIVLAVAFALVVFLITFAPLGELAWLAFGPSLVSFMVWMYRVLGDDGGAASQQALEEPASLELTKVTFTGFLALSVPTFSNNSDSNHAFTLLTAAAVITGLGWRLLTHATPAPRAIVKAANVASFCAHLCVAAAVIPFAVMACKALK